MKPTSTLLCSAALALLSAGAASLVASDPVPNAAPLNAPALQAATPYVPPPRLAEAQVAIQRDVMAVLRGAERSPSPAERFSRLPVFPRSLNAYTMVMTESAPAGVKIDPARIPFEVQQPAFKDGAGKPTIFLSGFYDVTSKSVMLYSSAAKTYVTAGEHPFVKARLPKK
jgi:hypothetical protein